MSTLAQRDALRASKFVMKPITQPSKQQRIARIRADLKDRVAEVEAEIEHIKCQVIWREISQEGADNKVWWLRDDIRVMKETAELDIERVKRL